MTPDPPWEDAPEWPVREKEVVWETPFFEAGYDLVDPPAGDPAEFYWLDPFDGAAVIAVTDDEELVMVEQYRPRHRTRALGLPGGFVEDGEDPEAAAARELREETGYAAESLTHLDTQVVSPWTRLLRHVYVATDLTAGAADPDETEFIEVVRLPVDEAIDRLRNSAGATNAVALGPLLLAREDGLL